MKAINFKSISLSEKEREAFAKSGTSWRSVWPVINSLPDADASIEKLAKMTVFEAENPDGPRPQILSRLHGRINSMRQRMEIQQIFRIAKMDLPKPASKKPAAKKQSPKGASKARTTR